MIERTLQTRCRNLASRLPVITVTGPRQAGKTTMVKAAFPEYSYTNLEFPDVREYALQDPRGFLGSFKDGVILDEVQNSPQLLSYIQGIVDQSDLMGRYILTGSQNLLLLQNVSQTLAGRSAILHLLPFSLEELVNHGYTFDTYEECIIRGFFPRLYDKQLTPQEWLPSYVESYIERDVRSIINIRDLRQFQTFLRLCAGRVGQVLNMSSLGNDVGVDQKTIRNWLSVLEATFTIFLVQPYYRNFSKRLIKAPKLYFYDTGLLCNLLGIRSALEIENYYGKGSLFENFVFAELHKNELNRARHPEVFYWRDSNNHEVDCIYEKSGLIHALEIKSGRTVASDFISGITWFKEIAEKLFASGNVIYGGEIEQQRSGFSILPWRKISEYMLSS